ACLAGSRLSRSLMIRWGLGCVRLLYQEDRLRGHTVTMTIWLLVYWPLLSTGAINLNTETQSQRLLVSVYFRLPSHAAPIPYTQSRKNQFQWAYSPRLLRGLTHEYHVANCETGRTFTDSYV